MTAFPQIVCVRQSFQRPRVDDINAAVHTALGSLNLATVVQPGQSVAITAGSRGITNIDRILRSVVDQFHNIGARPFLVPAMGSHGGGNSDGQMAVLKSLGITEPSVGCPIHASMDTVVLGETGDGVAVHCDRLASEADHVFVCGRVKPHTRFGGPYQSGLLKMMLTGLGKCEGASLFHKAFDEYGFDHVIETACPIILAGARVMGGLAIVENAYGETAELCGVQPREFLTRQRELLKRSEAWMAKLPLDHADVLLIDEIGKHISGTGMDTNVVGRKVDDHAAIDGEIPAIGAIIVRSVVGGNAIGIGMAEFCTKRAVVQTDLEATRLNGITARHESAAIMPPAYDTEAQAIEAARQSIGVASADQMRLVWITNTKEIGHFACSTACLIDLERRSGVEIIGQPQPMPFDPDGNLPPLIELMA